MAYKQPSSGSSFKMMGSSPAKQIKEIKGTSIFGKSPKELLKTVVDTNPTVRLYRKAKKAYDKYTKKPTKKESIQKLPKPELIQATGNTKMFGQKKGKLAKDSIKKGVTLDKKSTITDNKSMKPPYKKPVGPRAS